MLQEPPDGGMSRRDLLKLIGLTAGSAAMYQAMTSLGYAADSGYKGRIKLEGDPKGASVLILGAGLAGLTAALELRQAGYKVQVLEFNSRAGRRRNASSTRACISIPARGAFPITTTDCSTIASAWASSWNPSSS
jgi:NADPH-dependent 2,4-dienoyl-CoA reductase/sulfur reductase-like enzyme